MRRRAGAAWPGSSPPGEIFCPVFPLSGVPGTGIISVDVEDYFQVQAFSKDIDRSSWITYPSRVEQNTLRLLDIFDELNIKATFFILGWVADYYPGLVRQIVERGHEPACHSYWHRLVYELTPEQFASDAARAKDAIEQAAGARVYGYRAPSFSITARSAWALDSLRKVGFLYDSSIFPIHHDVYGFRDAPRGPFRLETPFGELLEFPLTTFRWSRGPALPVGGGGYLRILPRWYTRLGVRCAWNEGLPIVSYVHPWELDPQQPRLCGSVRSRLRHYTNLARTESRLRELLALGRFTSFRHSGLANFFPYSLLQTVGYP
jgi:polysaccharide deacetylase family protein (PEP-CTERM system associated)